MKPITVKDNKDAAARAAQDARYIAEMHKRRDEIVAGDLPSNEEVLIHALFLRNSIAHDRMVYVERLLLDISKNDTIDDPAIQRAIEHAAHDGTLDALQAARRALGSISHHEGGARFDIYLACAGDRDAIHRLIDHRWSRSNDGRFGELLRTATIRGFQAPRWQQVSSIEEAQHNGLDDIHRLGEAAGDYDAACEIFEADLTKTDTSTNQGLFAQLIADPDVADAMAEVEEDRAEIERSNRKQPRLLVVPALPKSVSGARKDVRKEFADVEGKPLPLVTRGDPWLHATMLAARWPHAKQVIETILGDMAATEAVRIRPTILVGDPGCGKSSLARAIAEQIGLPCEMFSMAGVHDASVMGTSAQWNSARASVPLQLVGRSKVANPCIIWDEIEKVGTARHNGSALDALLPMLEPSQSRRIRDLALEVEVDLSMVSHIATANSLEDVPAPLKDRMRIVQMPNPEWQHIGPLSRQIIRDIAKERGVDERWYPPLAPDELDVIRGVWPGGSLRKLHTAIQATLDARDMLLGRA